MTQPTFRSAGRFAPKAIALLLAIFTLGCANNEAPQANLQMTGELVNPTKKTEGGFTPARLDSLYLAYTSDPRSLNAVISSDTTSSVFQGYVYESLVTANMGTPDKFDVPKLATNWDFDEENLEFTFDLRKGVYWHPMNLPNGTRLPKTEFSACDVKFTFECILNKYTDAGSIRSYFLDSEGKPRIQIKVVDRYKVKIKWLEPYFLADLFTFSQSIIPKHVYGVDEQGDPIALDYTSKDFADAFNNHWANKTMCGTGPMMFKQWNRNEEFIMVRNLDYWGKPYYFSEIVYRSAENPQTLMKKILKSEIDFGGIAQKPLWFQERDRYAAAPPPEDKKFHVKFLKYSYPGYSYVGYSFKHPFLKNRKVRWALSHSIPVKKIIKVVYSGLADRTTGPFLPGTRPNDETLKPVAYDLQEANKLLDADGWKLNENTGVREKTINGRKVPAKYTLIIPSGSPAHLTMSQFIKSNQRSIGVDVEIKPLKWALMLEQLRGKSFDACMVGWGLSLRSDPKQLWHGSQADIPDSSNAIAYKNPELDALIDKLHKTMRIEDQIPIYRKIHKIIYDDQPYTFLVQSKATAVANARIENLKFYKPRPCYDVSEWGASWPRLKRSRGTQTQDPPQSE